MPQVIIFSLRSCVLGLSASNLCCMCLFGFYAFVVVRFCFACFCSKHGSFIVQISSACVCFYLVAEDMILREVRV